MTMTCTDADHAICIALTNEPSEVDDMALEFVGAAHTVDGDDMYYWP